jgi:hypothetical protein
VQRELETHLLQTFEYGFLDYYWTSILSFSTGSSPVTSMIFCRCSGQTYVGTKNCFFPYVNPFNYDNRTIKLSCNYRARKGSRTHQFQPPLNARFTPIWAQLLLLLLSTIVPSSA